MMSRQTVFRFGEHLITAVLTLVVAYVGLKGDEQRSNADIVSALYERVSELEKIVFEQNAQITQLQIELERKYETDIVLKDYLNAMPYPAWMKIVEVDAMGRTVFRMWHINYRYSNSYGVSQKRYEGKTDYQVWPYEVAEEFYQNDLHVLKKMDYRCIKEHWPKSALAPPSEDNPEVSGFVCKWVTKVNGKTAIAGQILESTINGQ